MQEHAGAIRDLGVSDMVAIGVKPTVYGGLQPDYWAYLQRRAVPLGRERAQQRPGLPKPRVEPPQYLKAKQPMKGRTLTERQKAAALSAASRRASYEMWQHEMAAREGLYTMEGVGLAIGRTGSAIRNAARKYAFPILLRPCPAVGYDVRMVRLADVQAWAEG
jgi:hypothetical protein